MSRGNCRGNCLEGVDPEAVEEKSDSSQVENPEDLSRAEMEDIDEQVWDAFEENSTSTRG